MMKQLQTTVTTVTIESNLDISSTVKTINLLDSSDSKWLRNHLIWAMNNGREVKLTNQSKSRS
jgi:hypothetical protein